MRKYSPKFHNVKLRTGNTYFNRTVGGFGKEPALHISQIPQGDANVEAAPNEYAIFLLAYYMSYLIFPYFGAFKQLDKRIFRIPHFVIYVKKSYTIVGSVVEKREEAPLQFDAETALSVGNLLNFYNLNTLNY